MHRRSIAVLVVLAGLALPVCAQHTARPGQGGVEGYGGPTYSSYAAVGRDGVLSTAQYGIGSTPHLGANPGTRPSSAESPFERPKLAGGLGRYSPDYRNYHDRDDHFHPPYLPLYGATTIHTTGFLGYSNPEFYVDLANPAPQPPAAPSAVGYDASPVRQTPHRGTINEAVTAAESYATPDRQAAAAPPFAFRPAYQRTQPTPDLRTEAAVTLVFNDGRPNEQIHNYMLTRKTLYVQEQPLREIPVDQLDLAATEKVNQEAGVDFRLPDHSY